VDIDIVLSSQSMLHDNLLHFTLGILSVSIHYTYIAEVYSINQFSSVVDVLIYRLKSTLDSFIHEQCSHSLLVILVLLCYSIMVSPDSMEYNLFSFLLES